MEAGSAPAIEVERLRAGYGATIVVDGVDLSVAPGEFVAILGSSGCGKTTLLRTIAGFQKAAAGRVRSFGRDMTDLPPERRDVAMVFQSYALWPHMTVLGNIGYGLRLRGMPREEISDARRKDPRDAEHGGTGGPQGHRPFGRAAPARRARPRARGRAAAAAARRAVVAISTPRSACSCAPRSRRCRAGSASRRCMSRTIARKP